MIMGTRTPKPEGGATWSKKHPQSSHVMKIAVDDQSGPLSTASTARPIQSSPCAMESPLCWESSGLGMRTEKFGRVPLAALLKKFVFTTCR
jgi:hypothetical protein